MQKIFCAFFVIGIFFICACMALVVLTLPADSAVIVLLTLFARIAVAAVYLAAGIVAFLIGLDYLRGKI